VYLPHHFAAQRIYIKTEKGQNELVRPRFGLDSRQRRILMGVDGIRNLRMLAEFCPETELEDILNVLIKQGFVVYVKESGATSIYGPGDIGKTRTLPKENATPGCSKEKSRTLTATPGCSKEKSRTLTQNLARFAAAKELMLEVAVVHLGILGRDIMQKIEQAESSDGLMMLAGRWSMALCESKTANRYAALYLEKLKLLLFEE
jgi:hypothetical protein